jgi:hypothetical protein
MECQQRIIYSDTLSSSLIGCPGNTNKNLHFVNKTPKSKQEPGNSNKNPETPNKKPEIQTKKE